MKKGRVVVCIIVAMLITTALFAQGAKQEKAAKTVLEFWTWRPENIEFYDGLIKDFTSKNPDIEIVQTAIKNTEYNTVLAAALQGGSGPDIFMGRSYGGLLTFSESGYLEPVEQWVPEVRNWSDAALGGAMDPNTGVIYGLPAIGNTMFCIYNKTMYDQLGLKIPNTWAEFINNLKRMDAAGITPLANGAKEGWCLEAMLGAVGPSFYGGDDFFNKVLVGETNFLDPKFKLAVSKMNELTPYMPELYMGVDYTQMQTMFVNEMAGHFIGGSFEASTFKAMNPDLEFGVFAIPGEKATDTKYVSVYADMNFAMNAASKNKEATARFMKYLGTVEVGNKYINELEMVSWTPGTDASSNPFIQRVLELQGKGAAQYIFLVGFRYEQPTGSALFQAASQGYLGGTMTLDQALREVQDGIASYFKPFQK